MDHTIWQTYKITGGTKTRMPVLKNIARNILCYIGEEKVESLAENFEKTHNTARNTPFPIDHEIENLGILLFTNQPIHNSTLKCIPQLIKNLIKKLYNNKTPGPDKISTAALKKLPTRPIIQLYYIFKTCLKL